MKQLTILLVGVLLAVSSCTKESQPPPELVGTWRWKRTGHLSGVPVTPENTGIEKLIVLKEDFTWEKLENNLTVGVGRFSVGHGTYLEFLYDSIVFHKPGEVSPAVWEYYEVKDSTLAFCTGFRGITGMMTYYARQSE